MIVVSGRTVVKASHLDAVVQAASTIAAASLLEPGCAAYRFGIDIDEPLALLLFEQWESDAALTEHFGTPHFQAFGEVLLEAADGPADFTRYEVSTAGPLFG